MPWPARLGGARLGYCLGSDSDAAGFRTVSGRGPRRRSSPANAVACVRTVSRGFERRLRPAQRPNRPRQNPPPPLPPARLRAVAHRPGQEPTPARLSRARLAERLQCGAPCSGCAAGWAGPAVWQWEPARRAVRAGQVNRVVQTRARGRKNAHAVARADEQTPSHMHTRAHEHARNYARAHIRTHERARKRKRRSGR